MKKIMIVAAATAAAIALADTTLTSSNVVGYQDIATPQGSSMRCSTFRTVLAASYPLSEIRVTGAEGSGDVVAQTISADGTWDGEYYYLTEDNTGMPDGWYKDPVASEAADDVVLAQGAALYITSEYNNLTLTVAGQVAQGDVVVQCAQGSGQIGNCTPVTVALNDVVVTGAEGSGDVVAQTISADGTWDGEYYYLTEDNTGMPDGWYKDPVASEAADDVDLAPGDALFVTSEYNDLTFTFPAVLN